MNRDKNPSGSSATDILSPPHFLVVETLDSYHDLDLS